jgi:DNA-binding NtrC family response regulator
MLYRWPGNIRELRTQVEVACEQARWQKERKGCLARFSIQPQLGDVDLVDEQGWEAEHTLPAVELPKLITYDVEKQFEDQAINDRLVSKNGGTPNKPLRLDLVYRLKTIAREEAELDAYRSSPESESADSRKIGSDQQESKAVDPDQAFDQRLISMKFEEVRSRYARQMVEACGGNIKKAGQRAGNGMKDNTITRICRQYEE